MAHAAQFRVIPTVDGGFLIVGNDELRKLLAAVVGEPRPGEKTRERKVRVALAQELAQPTQPAVQTPVLPDPVPTSDTGPG